MLYISNLVMSNIYFILFYSKLSNIEKLYKYIPNKQDKNNYLYFLLFIQFFFNSLNSSFKVIQYIYQIKRWYKNPLGQWLKTKYLMVFQILPLIGEIFNQTDMFILVKEMYVF